MDDLIEFLRARLDEDAEAAREAADGDSGGWFVGDKWNVYRIEDETPHDAIEENRLVVYGAAKTQSDHVARHDPARVLAEVEAKRELLRVAEAAADFAPTFTTGVAAKLEDVLRRFARAYREHPDYRPKWAPEGSST